MENEATQSDLREGQLLLLTTMRTICNRRRALMLYLDLMQREGRKPKKKEGVRMEKSEKRKKQGEAKIEDRRNAKGCKKPDMDCGIQALIATLLRNEAEVKTMYWRKD